MSLRTAMIEISFELAETVWRYSDQELFELHDDGTESSLVEGETLLSDRRYGIEGELFGRPYCAHIYFSDNLTGSICNDCGARGAVMRGGAVICELDADELEDLLYQDGKAVEFWFEDQNINVTIVLRDGSVEGESS